MLTLCHTLSSGVHNGEAGADSSVMDELEVHRRLVDQLTDYAIFALDADGRVLTWNAGARQLTGYTEGEIVGRHVSMLYSPEDAASGRPARDLEAAARLGHHDAQRWRTRKDGNPFWGHVITTALHDESGELVGFGKVVRDLTDLRQATSTLAANEEWFRLVVQAVKDYAIFMLDPEGHVTSWNEGAQRIKGYTAQDIVGQHFSVFYPEEDLVWDKPAVELEAAYTEGRFEDEGWRLRKDGSRFWANVIITPVIGDQGDLIGFAKITRDLSERRDAEHRALAAARRIAEVEAASRAKSEFLAAMSHELRTPLNAIGGYVDLLALGIRGPLTQRQHEDLERIRRSQQHLLAIITDLLHFSRIDAGHVEYRVDPIPLADIIEAAQGMLEAQAESRGIEVQVDAAVEAQAVVAGDRTKLEQIVLNLLTNALKFTSAGGRICISQALSDERIMLSVEDTGVGIAPDEVDSIFEPFVQVGRSASTRGGMGLGLAISREFARGMGGELVVQSELGVGSTFTLVLPRYRSADNI